MSRHVKKREFSKIITGISIGMWVVVNAYALVMMAVFMDLAPLAWVLGSVDAAVAIIIRFYFKKAEKENEIKLRKTYGDLAREIEKNTREETQYGF